MAANLSTEKKAKAPHGKRLTVYDIVIGILALFSLVILIVPLIIPLPQEAVDLLNTVENLLCFVFLADFLRSLVRAPNKGGYFLKGGGWLDLLGSIPFGKFAVFRVARLFRIARVMRTLRGNDYRKLMTGQLAENTLLFTLVTALMLVFTIAFLVLKAEQGNLHANITNYTNAVWWAFVTIATVGYGDYYPVSNLGRFFAILLMFAGLGVIGVLSSFLASTFISFQRRRERKRGEGNENGEQHDEDKQDAGTEENEMSALRAELAAMKQELTEIEGILEKRYEES